MKDIAKNKKAYFDYEVLDKVEAGMALFGTEIKSLRQNGASIQEAYVSHLESELYLINATIPLYRYGNIHNHEEKRKRKLLLHKKEIKRLKQQNEEKGFTLIPLKIYLNEKGLAKCLIGVCRGKKTVDKRNAIKEREVKKSMERALKSGR